MSKKSILIADCIRGIYAWHHAAKKIQEFVNDGWTFSDMENLAYAVADAEQAMEVATDLERARMTNPEGVVYVITEEIGGDIFMYRDEDSTEDNE